MLAVLRKPISLAYPMKLVATALASLVVPSSQYWAAIDSDRDVFMEKALQRIRDVCHSTALLYRIRLLQSVPNLLKEQPCQL